MRFQKINYFILVLKPVCSRVEGLNCGLDWTEPVDLLSLLLNG